MAGLFLSPLSRLLSSGQRSFLVLGSLLTLGAAERLAGQVPAAPTPTDIITQEYAALNRHDVNGVFAVYSDSIQYGDLSDSGRSKLTTKAELAAAFGPFLAQNPRSHVTVAHEMAIGPFVLAHEIMSGAADGKPFSIIDISEVRGGRVVAELETGNLALTPPAEVHQADFTARRADDAFARGADDAAMPAYAEPVLFHVWGEDSVQHMTRAKMRKGFRDVLAANPGMHFVVVDRMVAGPFAVVHERLTGMADGKVRDAFDVMEVRGERIVAEWGSPWQLQDAGN